MTLPPYFWADSIRTLVIAAYALLTGQVLGILWYYTKANHIERRREPGRDGRFLPSYIWLISVGVLGVTTECVIFTISRVGKPLAWWSVMNLIVFSMVNIALRQVLCFEHLRYLHDHEEPLPGAQTLAEPPKLKIVRKAG